MTSIPTITLNDGNAIPQLGFGVFQIEPAETAQAVVQALEIGYRHIDTAEMYRNERGRGRGHPRRRARPRATCTSPASSTTASTSPTTPARAFEQTLAELGFDHVDLFLIHWPLPTLLRRRLRVDLEGARGVQGRRPGAFDRRLELPGGAPRAARRRVRRRPGGQPDRAAPVLPEPRGARVRRGPRHRHRGVVADRPGRGARRSGGHRDRRAGRPIDGAGRVALAHPARTHRVPEVGHAGADRARTSSCSTSSSTRTTRRPSTVSIVVSPAGAARIPTQMAWIPPA